MRLLGVDFGFSRIGIAVGESEPRVVSPRPSFAAAGALKRDAVAIGELAKREEAQAIILGLPLKDGEEERMARICRMLAGHLEDLGFTVHLVDETLSSVEAENVLFEAGLKASQRRKARDGEAACRIIERYLDASTP